ncbi:MAG: hypothetical protein RL432_206, partial [Bacteroidota bacterium]
RQRQGGIVPAKDERNALRGEKKHQPLDAHGTRSINQRTRCRIA